MKRRVLSVRVQHGNMRESTICERDTQNLIKEEESCEKTSFSNMTISSSLSVDVLQVTKENNMVQYDQPPIFDEEDQVMTMDKGPEISLYLQHKDRIEGNNNANPSHSTDASSVAFEEDLIVGSFATTAAPLHSKTW
jgi:hypothetical protein